MKTQQIENENTRLKVKSSASKGTLKDHRPFFSNPTIYALYTGVKKNRRGHVVKRN